MTGGHLSRRELLSGLTVAALAGTAHPGSAAGTTFAEEAPLDPDRPIIDPHHHLFDYRDPALARERYRAADFLSDVSHGGHRIEQSVFVECGSMYYLDGPIERRSLGETEYVRRIGDAQANATCRVASGIVAKVDLRLGARAGDILRAHIDAGGGRVKGIRNSIAWDAHPPLAAMGLNKDLLEDADFLEGFKTLEPLGLSFDIWLLHPQIPALVTLARRFPGTRIILNHCGDPLGIGPYAGRGAEVLADWNRSMTALAECPNVYVKLGGLGPFGPVPGEGVQGHGSIALAAQWRPYIERSIELFGHRRCMFESNYPSNARVARYGVTWNAFKRVAKGASAEEQDWLFRRTAQTAYRL